MPKIYSLLILFLFAAFTVQAQKLPNENGEPVIINRDTLFKFYAPQGLFDPKERAGIVTKRIEALMSRIDFNPDSLTLKNDTSISIITYNGQMIMGVNNTDASYSELNRPQLAASYLSILKNKLGNVFESNSPKQLITNVLEAVAVIILLIVLIWVVNKGFRWIKLKIIQGWERRGTGGLRLAIASIYQRTHQYRTTAHYPAAGLPGLAGVVLYFPFIAAYCHTTYRFCG
jgi:hypothetical protein